LVRNQSIVAAAKSSDATVALTHTITTSTHVATPIKRICGLKMNTNGSNAVRKLYHVACQPVLFGSAPEIAAAA
jgi:hypothetical protein